MISQFAVTCQNCSHVEHEDWLCKTVRYQANNMNTNCMCLQPDKCTHHSFLLRMLPTSQCDTGVVQLRGSSVPRAVAAVIKREGIAGLYGGVGVTTWAAG